MGEVYRADDLKLGQPVALKFLPPDVDKDPARLTQLHTEVRMARQVSHPNVCRVYDIDEVDGHTFLSMEYVDGEDLSSLLRRVGRFPLRPRDRDGANIICAGLAAAHPNAARACIASSSRPNYARRQPPRAGKDPEHGRSGLASAAVITLRAGDAGLAAVAPGDSSAARRSPPRSDLYMLGLVLHACTGAARHPETTRCRTDRAARAGGHRAAVGDRHEPRSRDRSRLIFAACSAIRRCVPRHALAVARKALRRRSTRGRVPRAKRHRRFEMVAAAGTRRARCARSSSRAWQSVAGADGPAGRSKRSRIACWSTPVDAQAARDPRRNGAILGGPSRYAAGSTRLAASCRRTISAKSGRHP
jgi:hypothetical protein